MEVSGATRLFPIIGDPVTHVESPVRLTRTLTEGGHDAVCIPVQVAEGHLGLVMAGLAVSGNVDGILVTMPHKRAAFGYCATSSERARMLGVVSVIRRNPDGTWHGDMLDGLAFVKAQVDHGARVEGARALLVGAGAAGAAIAIALLEAGVRELVVHDADASRVADLLRLLAGHGDGGVSSGPPDPRGCDLVFNASPLGMDDGDPLPVDAGFLGASMFVGDVISGHGATRFIVAARAAGCATADGADMVEAVQTLMADFMIGGQRPPATD
ncbi:shikimate dehydrogenase family protein [Angustibacter sp. McL0619]|uniref:shikimate dehydrogenase family protein n=1 Tax=Angustibacter sp. McL0619 TaxID=3415676 RepID=UPI003CE89B1D